MYLLFDKTGKNIGHCDFQPNLEDLASREESAIAFDGEIQGTATLVNGEIIWRPPQPSPYHIWNKDEWVVSKTLKANFFMKQRETVLNRLAEKTDQLKSQVLAGYPQTEIDSFYRQEREAREWLADNRTPTPMLSAIAENRGVPLAILIEKVVEKADQLAGIMGAILGQKQALEDRLQAVENPQKIAEIAEEIEQWQLSI